MVMFSENQPSSQLEALLLQTAAGDREAFASLYHRTSPSVYGLALTYVRSGPDAEDVTQDTFVKVWDNAPAYRPQGKPLAWILTIAKNLALMCLRSREKSTFVTALGLEGCQRLVDELTARAVAALDGFGAPEFHIWLAESLARRNK